MTLESRQTRRQGKTARTKSARRPQAEPLEERQLLSNVFTVTNTLDDGSTGSLRWAITQVDGDTSDSAASSDQIDFSIPQTDPGFSGGVWTMHPLTLLPTVTKPVLIDGYTQPGASANTNGPDLADNAHLTVALSGDQQDPGANLFRTGLVLASSNVVVRGLIVERFADPSDTGGTGIVISSPGGDVVEGDFIGTDDTSSTHVGNITGVAVSGDGNTIGGTTPDARNMISGNIAGPSGGGVGVILDGNANVVEGDFIGTDTTGTASDPNSYASVWINVGGNNTIGGTTPEARNIIAGNNLFGAQNFAAYGVLINGQGASDNVIEGNFIGTDVTGTTAVAPGTPASPNTTDGVAIYGALVVDMVDNTIGGTAAGAGNVIAGNGEAGIWVGPSNSAFDTVIEGNFIGADATGQSALGNGSGIDIDSSSTTIGGTSAGARNIISGNDGAGINVIADFMANPTTGTVIEGNFIGTDASGQNPLGNGGDGVVLGMTTETVDTGNVTRNSIGGTAAGTGNVIAFNQGAGVAILGGITFDDPILGNSIFGNAKLGIDLGGSGVPLVNADSDSSFGPNLSQDYPFVTGVLPVVSGSLVGEIGGTLDSAPNQTYRIEFFSNLTPDPSGFGQGQTYLGSMDVTTDESGTANFSFSYGGNLAGRSISATATDSQGNTSEFSPDVPPVSQGPAIVLSATPNPALPGQAVTVTAALPSMPLHLGNTVSPTPVAPFGYVAFFVDGQPVQPPDLAHPGAGSLGSESGTIIVIPNLGAGSHVITARYEGGNFPPSDSGPLTVTVVNSLKTSARLTVAPDPVAAGQPVTFNAVVTSSASLAGQRLPTPTGFVDFREGSVTLARVAVDATGHAHYTTSALSVGAHDVIAIYEGDAIYRSATSNSVTEFVNPITGPTVLSVQRYGIHAQPTSIVLTFSQPLDLASAEATYNYQVSGPGGRPIRVNSAVYNAAADTVTLAPARNLNVHDRYRLTINGTAPDGVRDVYGNLLDGTGPGTSYATTLTARNLVSGGPRQIPQAGQHSRHPLAARTENLRHKREA